MPRWGDVVAFLAGVAGMLVDGLAGRPMSPLFVGLGLIFWIETMFSLARESRAPGLARIELLGRLAFAVLVTAFLWFAWPTPA